MSTSHTFAFIQTCRHKDKTGWVIRIGGYTSVVVSKYQEPVGVTLMLDALEDFQRHVPADLADTTITVHTSMVNSEVFDEEEILPPNAFLTSKAIDKAHSKSLRKAFVNHFFDDGPIREAEVAAAAERLATEAAADEYFTQITESDVIISVAAEVTEQFDSGENFIGSAYTVSKGTSLSNDWYGRMFKTKISHHMEPCTFPLKPVRRKVDIKETIKDTLYALREALRVASQDHPISADSTDRVFVVLDSSDVLNILNGSIYARSTAKIKGAAERLEEVKELLSGFPNVELVPQSAKEIPPLWTSRSLSRTGAALRRKEVALGSGRPEKIEQAEEEADLEAEKRVASLSKWVSSRFAEETAAA